MAIVYTGARSRGDLAALPSWITNIGKSVAASFNPTVTIATPVGPITIDPRDKNQVRALTDALKKSRINVSANASAGAPPTDRSPVQAIDDTVQAHIPGGWVTIALAAVGFALLVKGRH